MTISLRRLEESDLEAADRVLRAAFERSQSFLPNLRLTRAVQPDGILVAEEQTQIVGTVGAVDYGPLAYIGLMAVDPHRQGRGIGRRLISGLLEWLDRRACPLALLDATDRGAALYETLGFVDDHAASVFEWDDPSSAGNGLAAASRVGLARPDERAEVTAFDAPIFGADRDKLFRALWSDNRDRCLLARDPSGNLRGYLFARDPVLGPWAATELSVAEDLLSAALALSFARPPQVLVPRSNQPCGELLARRGFTLRRRLRHMRRGGSAPPGQPTRLFGQSSFAHG